MKLNYFIIFCKKMQKNAKKTLDFVKIKVIILKRNDMKLKIILS